MNKLEETLSTILEKSLELAERTGEFAIEQAPLLLQEFYAWHTITAVMGIAIAVLLAIVIHLITKRLVKNTEDEVLWAVEFFQIIPLLILCVNAYELAFIITAPKLYLIEYFIH